MEQFSFSIKVNGFLMVRRSRSKKCLVVNYISNYKGKGRYANKKVFQYFGVFVLINKKCLKELIEYLDAKRLQSHRACRCAVRIQPMDSAF